MRKSFFKYPKRKKYANIHVRTPKSKKISILPWKNLLLSFIGLILLFFMSTCAPAAQESQPPQDAPLDTAIIKTIEVEKEVVVSSPTAAGAVEFPKEPIVEVTQTQESATFPGTPPEFFPTVSPVETPTASTIQPPAQELHLIELEWPPRMRMGDSDIIRLALVPFDDGYTIYTEFPEHEVITQTIQAPRDGGYDLFAVARLDGIGFLVSPNDDFEQYFPPGQALVWKWTLTPLHSGQQRLTINLILRWKPANSTRVERQYAIYSKSLDVQVLNFFGLSHPQVLATGMVGIFLGSSISLAALLYKPYRRSLIETRHPNTNLQVEFPDHIQISVQERSVLQSLFGRYSRLIIKQEFLSGYSGARTFLVLPVRADGHEDAFTIAKLGEQKSIEVEFSNYENFVKDTLPPVTARIQNTPVTCSITPLLDQRKIAAIQYTFIGQHGSTPTSLRQKLVKEPNPELLMTLFETFGPGWWFQRSPFTFRIEQEYDRFLPTHLVVEPAPEERPTGEIDGNLAISDNPVNIGQVVALRNLSISEIRADGTSLSLLGRKKSSGQIPLRVRWLCRKHPEGSVGRVVANRNRLLQYYTKDVDLQGLPDPIQLLPDIMSTVVSGSRSIIHGDLNLENILIGPGNLLWLIDFAQTRNGHTLIDFAHLYAEVIAHIVSSRIREPAEFISALCGNPSPKFSRYYFLLATLDELSMRCLFHPNRYLEWHLAAGIACLGALKFLNLDTHSRHLLYLASAWRFEKSFSSFSKKDQLK